LWIKAEDLECDYRCGSRFMDRGDRHSTVQAARAMGWRCFLGISLTKKDIEVHICPMCIDRKRAKDDDPGNRGEQLMLG
jgi:hypothetical protein